MLALRRLCHPIAPQFTIWLGEYEPKKFPDELTPVPVELLTLEAEVPTTSCGAAL